MTNVFVILDPFLPIYPVNDLKNENFEEMKKKHLKKLPFYTFIPYMKII